MGIFKILEMNVDLLRLGLDGDYAGHDNDNLMISNAISKDGGKGFGCGGLCARCGLALTSNQPHRFTPNALDYTDGSDHPYLFQPN